MSYDLAGPIDRAPYWSITVKSFGASAATYRLKGPKGRKGLVRDILVDVTTTMVGTTTVPEVQVGAAAGTNSAASVDYARFRLGTAAGTGYDTTSGAALRARALCSLSDSPSATVPSAPKPVLSDFTGHIALETAFLPADTAFFISLVDGTGGSPAGAASVYVFIDWF